MLTLNRVNNMMIAKPLIPQRSRSLAKCSRPQRCHLLSCLSIEVSPPHTEAHVWIHLFRCIINHSLHRHLIATTLAIIQWDCSHAAVTHTFDVVRSVLSANELLVRRNVTQARWRHICLLRSSLPVPIRFGLENCLESFILPFLCGVRVVKPRREAGGSFHLRQLELEVITSTSHIHRYNKCFANSTWTALVQTSLKASTV